MAKRFAVVPEYLLKKLKTENIETKTEAPQVVVEEEKNEINEIIQMLSKPVRNRAKVLLSTIMPKIRLNSENKIIYPDGTIGSHLYILLNYELNNFKTKEQPFDYSKFKRLFGSQDVMRENWISLFG